MLNGSNAGSGAAPLGEKATLYTGSECLFKLYKHLPTCDGRTAGSGAVPERTCGLGLSQGARTRGGKDRGRARGPPTTRSFLPSTTLSLSFPLPQKSLCTPPQRARSPNPPWRACKRASACLDVPQLDRGVEAGGGEQRRVPGARGAPAKKESKSGEGEKERDRRRLSGVEKTNMQAHSGSAARGGPSPSAESLVLIPPVSSALPSPALVFLFV